MGRIESVGRTKRSAVPAIARHLPERRFAWSGLPQNQTLNVNSQNLCFPFAGFAIFCGHSQIQTHVTEQLVFAAKERKDRKVVGANFLLQVYTPVLERGSP